MMKRLLSALGAGCFLMLAALWLTGATTGVVPVSGGGGGCAIVSMALSNNTFDSGTPNAAVGTVSTTTTGACASPTYAMVSSGSDHASTACNTSSGADFTVTGAAVAANGSPGAGPYNGICISSTIASATGSPFVQAFNITGAAVSCTITGVSISNNTFNSNIANAAVGMLSATTTGTCGAATYAIVSSGTDHSGTTCNAASGTDFTATAGAVAANGSPGAGTYTAICASATIGGATGSPFTQAFTITGAPNTTLTQLQAINSGSTQTNVPFSVGVPFDISTMDGSHHLTASDSTNGTLTCDETNRYSDIGGLNSGTAQVRGTTLSCNLPSWPNGADNITVAIASGAPGSGTDISTSDLTTASFDLTATVVTMNGTTETAQLSTAFANVGFVNITTPAILGKWRSGGGVVTGYVFFMPFKNGGTADPNGLYGLFDVECYKAHTTAVNVSTNPILGCHIDLLTGNGVAELSSPLGASYSLLGYGISFAGGAGGTTTMTNWAATAPTQTLTFTNHKFTATITNASPSFISFPTTIVALSDSSTFFLTTTGALPTGWSTGTPYALTSKSFNGTTGTITGALTFGGANINASSAGSGVHTIWPEIIGTVTASAPLWTSDSVGTVISDGTFYGVITNVSSSTIADVSIYRPLPGLSTLTSGNYRLLPINHYYASRVRFSGDWVNTATAAPLRVQNGNLYLGNAWDNSAHTGGPAPYLVSAKAMPNYNIIADPGVTAFASYLTNCPSTVSIWAMLGNARYQIRGLILVLTGPLPSATGGGTIEGQACGGLGAQ